MPEMHHVDSESIEAIGYDRDAQELHIRFLKSGETYVYYSVEKWVFDDILQTESKGRYLNENIRGRYEFGRV